MQPDHASNAGYGADAPGRSGLWEALFWVGVSMGALVCLPYRPAPRRERELGQTP